jgi:hypothetical protein
VLIVVTLFTGPVDSSEAVLSVSGCAWIIVAHPKEIVQTNAPPFQRLEKDTR